MMDARRAPVLVALMAALCCLPTALSFSPLRLPPSTQRPTSPPSSCPSLRPLPAVPSAPKIRKGFGLGLRVLGAPNEDEGFVDFVNGIETMTPPPEISDEEAEREQLLGSGLVGMRLYSAFKDHINMHYTNQLKCMAMKLHDPEEEPWSGGELILHQANILAMDSRGFDIQVTLCSGGTCWLSVVHARLPYRAETPGELFSAFDDVCESCMCTNDKDVSCYSRIPQEILPEYFDQMTTVLNQDFLQQVNNTISDLSGLDGASGEYIATIRVSDVTCEGFKALVNFCNVEKCSSVEVDISFPRAAADPQDFREELTACLGEAGSIHQCFVKEVNVVDLDFDSSLQP
mmetsp:Transcript_44041/g.107601  ORF Transcript_44041/g.107601 Transcript_44041/m.107601 type:complete len:345 (-) Transcript_44041:28-1062(-)